MGRQRKHSEIDVVRHIVDMELNKIKKNKLHNLIGSVTLEDVGNELGYTKERIRQIYLENKKEIHAQVDQKAKEIKI